MPHMVGLTFRLTGWLREDVDTKAFVAYCPPLDLYTAGRTRDEGRQALRSGAEMFIRLCYDRGILERVLRARGFATARPEGDPSPAAGDFITYFESSAGFEESFGFDVPLPLVSNLDAAPCPQ